MDLRDIKDVSVFADHVGTQFHVQLPDKLFVMARLLEAEPLQSVSGGAHLAEREPFSLLFEVDGGADLPQQIYEVHHEVLGVLPLFLVPVGAGILESIFN